jgi:hypothetical protein
MRRFAILVVLLALSILSHQRPPRVSLSFASLVLARFCGVQFARSAGW